MIKMYAHANVACLIMAPVRCVTIQFDSATETASECRSMLERFCWISNRHAQCV